MHLARCLADTGSSPSIRQRMELEYLRDALEGLLCAICAMNPPITVGLISRFVNSHFPSDESLDVVAAVLRSEGVIDTIFESTENPLFECCSHLTRCLHAETIQNQQNEAIRYMRLFARLMDVNQPTSLRIHVGALVCDKILPRLFDLFTPPLHHIQPSPSSFTSHYSSSLSLWNVRRVAVELCRTLMIPLERPSEQCSPTMYQTCLAHLLSDTLKNSITRNDFILPEFIQSLLLEASKPVVGTRTISVFAIPTDYSDDSLATMLTGPPVSPSHVPPIDSLSPSGLCAWIRGCARDLQFNYHIHPSHIPAFLSLQCCETPRQDAHLSVMHIRLLICSLLFPFVSIPLESSYRTLITELPALRGFELALARTSFVIGRSVTTKVWNDAYHLPIGAESDLWDMRQLTQSLFPDSQTGFESLCFLVRSCPHPQVPSSPALQSEIFNLHQCSTDCRPAFSSILSETDVLQFLAKFIVQHTVMHSFSMSTCSSQNTTPRNIKFECCSIEQASCSPAELEQPPPVGSEPLCGWGEFLMRSLKSTVSASIFTPPFSSSIVFPKSQRTAFAHFGPSDPGWDCTVAQPAPLHHLLSTALFLCLPGYSECLTAINVPAPPGSRELVSQCVRRLETSLLLRDLVQYELRTIHSPLMYQPSGVEELAELTSLASPPNLLTFALDALCSYYLNFRSNSPRLVEVATIGFEHLSTGVLDLILALLDCISHSSSQELRSSTQIATLDFAPDATVSRSTSTRRHHRLIHLARVDFKRQLSALTAGATEKSASTKSTTESAARSAESTSSVWAKGTGFCTGSCTSAWDTETLNRKVLIEDSYAIMFFNVLAAFLWAFAVDGPKCLVRHISLHLSQSSLLSLITSYLRNDSALDLAMRVPLYRTIFRFLRVVAHCPPMYWIFTTTDQAVGQVESLLTQSSCLSDHWYTKSSSTWLEHLSHPMDESLPDGLDHSCPIRLLRDLQNYLITYERHFKKLDFPCGESPPLSTGPQIPVSAGSHVRDISVGKRKTGLTRQHSVRCRNPRGQTKSENFGVKLLDKVPIKAKASLSGTMEVSTNESETETLTASTPLDPEVNPFDLLQWKRQSTPVGLLQLSRGPIDIRRNDSQLVSPAHDDPLNCSESVVESYETLGDSSSTTIPHQETHLNRLEHLKPIRGKTDDHTAKHALSDNDPSAEPNHCAPCLTEYSDKWTPLTQPSSSHQTRKTPPPGGDLHLLIDELRITFSMARLLVRLMEQVVLPSSGNTTVHAHDRISQPDPTSSTVLTSGSCRNQQMYFERLHPFQFDSTSP
ncbi:unnamed protein product [Dicrocoelium dendriticum]|nr:unnamed protein product [Dicrocoelium dendriticum]